MRWRQLKRGLTVTSTVVLLFYAAAAFALQRQCWQDSIANVSSSGEIVIMMSGQEKVWAIRLR